MKFVEKSDEEILKIANPIWDNLVDSSNKKDYLNFSKLFSKEMLKGANEIAIANQWEKSDLLTSLSTHREFLGCLRRDKFVTVLWKQFSDKVQGDHLGRLVLADEDGEVKIFGATIY
ncbi:MAG: hypothetical protein V3R51_07005 [Gammaproteobacteria bacterium]